METSSPHVSKLDQFMENSEFNRFGLICVILIIVGCLGGLTVGFGAIQYTGTLIAVVVPTMSTLSLLIAVAPMRYIYFSAAVSIVIDILLIAYFSLT
jgi:hypothetical protein